MPNVRLNISRTENGQYLVVVNGEGYFNAVNKAVGARIRGEDTFFDDSLFGIGSAPIIRAGKRELRHVQGGSWKCIERRLGTR